MKLKDEKVGFRNWIIILLVGFAGQFAWAIENMYLNTFMVEKDLHLGMQKNA